MPNGIVYRIPKGSPLTAEEMDNNLLLLSNGIDSISDAIEAGYKLKISDTEPSAAERLLTLWVKRNGSAFVRNAGDTEWVRVEQPALYAESTGSSGAYVVTIGITIDNYSDIVGVPIAVKVNHNSPGGGSTLNVNGLVASPAITKTGAIAIAEDELVSTAVYLMIYDGSSFQVVSPVSSEVDVANIEPGTVGQVLATLTGTVVGWRAFMLSTAATQASTITAPTPLVIPHNLPVVPGYLDLRWKCRSAEFGYAVNDEIPNAYTYVAGGGGVKFTCYADATNIYIVDSVGTSATFTRKTDGVYNQAITLANWDLYVRYSI